MKKLSLAIAVISAVLVLVFFWSHFRVPQILNNPSRGNNIVVLGDSLTVGVGDVEGGGWVPIVEKKLGVTITRFANSGDTVADGLARINDVRAVKPDMVLVFLGGNDALRRYPIEDTFSGLKKIITILQDDGALVVLVGVRGGIFGDRYRTQFESLAKETHSALVPDVMNGIFGNPKLLSEDQIHPNIEGYKLIGERIGNVVNKYIPPRR